jgi:hypothetical protein
VNVKRIIAVTTAVLLTSVCVYAQQAPVVRHVSGEIGWVDIQQGKLDLNQETPKGTHTISYRISQNETRVTDPADVQFLNVGDLRAGQEVTIDVADGQEDKIVQKIMVNPEASSEYQLAYGQIKDINVAAGTLVVEEKVRIGQQEQSRLSNYVFDPKTVVVMRSPNKEPIDFVLKPGDVVKVEFVGLDGKQQARYITLYSPTVSSTTVTTTTVTTTQ